MNGLELRRSFVEFFRERGHVELPSLPLIPRDDPSVLFVTAGMQQMIPFFLGQAMPPSKRLVTIQKCLRTVDIEEVGDESHLTFFEMLGNFSVGDYFVPEALRFTWEYLTEVLRIPGDRLWATIYPGDELARSTWLEIGLPGDRIVPDPDNWWWRAGLAGPAGPDSEVHYDRGIQYGCGGEDCGPVCENADCHRFVEIWNNVFMQSLVDDQNRVQRPLRTRNIDTGQGFERLLMVVQEVETVYETDVFLPIIQIVARTVGKPYKGDAGSDRSMRIIADHCRALTMAIADGAAPGNEGRGYVLRRLLRRAVLRARLLGVEGPFLQGPVRATITSLAQAHPEVAARSDSVLDLVRLEEERFEETLRRGLPLVDDLMNQAMSKGGVVDGKSAFTLHDTFGFPLELIEEIAGERDLSVNVDEFQEALRDQQRRARAARVAGGDADLESLAALSERIEPTVFMGYSEIETESRIEGIITNGRLVEEASEGEQVEVILDRTPFYAESGGQVGDSGEIEGPEGRIAVADTQRPYGAIIVHRGRVVSGRVVLGENVAARIDAARRARIRPHHSATHLLHVALHEVLGPEATQAGSLVAPDRLRFDFRWPHALSRGQLTGVQDRINELVFEDDRVITRELPYDQAISEGAMALFGEKYGDLVRVVVMGPSKELCGGTHVSETVEIGPVVIVSESGIGAGLRRIEALAGQATYEHLLKVEGTLEETADVLGVRPDRVVERVRDVVGQLRSAEKRLAHLRSQVVQREAVELAATAEWLNGRPANGTESRLVVKRVDATLPDDLFQLALVTASSMESGIVVVGSVIDGKPHFAAAVSSDLQARGYSARSIAQQVGRAVSGGAGGTESFAQGGGRDAAELERGLEAAREFIVGSPAAD